MLVTSIIALVVSVASLGTAIVAIVRAGKSTTATNKLTTELAQRREAFDLSSGDLDRVIKAKDRFKELAHRIRKNLDSVETEDDLESVVDDCAEVTRTVGRGTSGPLRNAGPNDHEVHGSVSVLNKVPSDIKMTRLVRGNRKEQRADQKVGEVVYKIRHALECLERRIQTE